jgi:hypothetical protein
MRMQRAIGRDAGRAVEAQVLPEGTLPAAGDVGGVIHGIGHTG